MKLQPPIAALIILFPILPFLSSTVIADLNSEKEALLDFSDSVYHSQKLNWDDSTPVCSSWIGITCNSNQSSVVAIHLPAIGIFGSIPENTIGKLDSLRVLSLHSNFLYGTLPSDVLSIPSLEYLYLQHNNFSDAIPDFLPPSLIVLDFSFNSFSGIIPTIIHNLTRLTQLSLQNNSISGAIPNLNLTELKLLNLSYNNFNGSIPYSLQKFPLSSFVGNSLLCGEPLKHCFKLSSSSPSPSPIHLPAVSPTFLNYQNAKHAKKLLGRGSIIALAVGGAAVLFSLVFMIIICCLKKKRKQGGGAWKAKGAFGDEKADQKSMSISFGSGVQAAEKNKLFFFEGCHFNFDLEDLLRASAEVLGKGSYGTTYKAVLDEETTVVVKRLKETVVSKREFEQQMELVDRVGKHPNVVPQRAYYYSRDEKLLVYNYMPAGSLFAHLHGSSDAGRSPLDWDSRLKISIGIARGIGHIHSEGGVKFIHGNIKSTNVLLTQDLDACISDVGLNPLMDFPASAAMSRRATGYRAPEAIDMRKMSHKSDVYSFGVLLLEMLTGKTTLQIAGHYDNVVVDLPRWVKSVVREEWTAEVFDVELLKQQGIEEEMVQMLQIALSCVAKLPESRPSINEVIRMLEEIRQSDTKTRPSSESELDVQSTP